MKNIELEKALLGCVIQDSQQLDHVKAWVPSYDFFYNDFNQRVWKAIIKLDKDKKDIDLNTVADTINIVDTDSNRRIDESEISQSTFVSVWNDTTFLHQFDNDTISSPYQDGRYHYGILGGSGTGDNIVSPIFVVVDTENEEDFYHYFKP